LPKWGVAVDERPRRLRGERIGERIEQRLSRVDQPCIQSSQPSHGRQQATDAGDGQRVEVGADDRLRLLLHRRQGRPIAQQRQAVRIELGHMERVQRVADPGDGPLARRSVEVPPDRRQRLPRQPAGERPAQLRMTPGGQHLGCRQATGQRLEDGRLAQQARAIAAPADAHHHVVEGPHLVGVARQPHARSPRPPARRPQHRRQPRARVRRHEPLSGGTVC
jgi:hypothetical protein